MWVFPDAPTIFWHTLGGYPSVQFPRELILDVSTQALLVWSIITPSCGHFLPKGQEWGSVKASDLSYSLTATPTQAPTLNYLGQSKRLSCHPKKSKGQELCSETGSKINQLEQQILLASLVPQVLRKWMTRVYDIRNWREKSYYNSQCNSWSREQDSWDRKVLRNLSQRQVNGNLSQGGAKDWGGMRQVHLSA